MARAKGLLNKEAHVRIPKGSSQGRRPTTSSMNKHKRRQTGVKTYKGQGR
jgi:hypothetical protein|tara:strand:+ start:336 stop:485 length:150 start_codon:yes stop_codon:yes gene_type:complete